MHNDLLDQLKVRKGTRQGCPLLPFLFLMVLEILLRLIREDKDIVELKIKGFS